jgi:hypothetical protein
VSTIKPDFGQGGANLTPEGSGEPSLADALRDVADDMAALNGSGNRPATIASADATDLATAITLVNEIKTALNAVSAPTIKTLKG